MKCVAQEICIILGRGNVNTARWGWGNLHQILTKSQSQCITFSPYTVVVAAAVILECSTCVQWCTNIRTHVNTKFRHWTDVWDRCDQHWSLAILNTSLHSGTSEGWQISQHLWLTLRTVLFHWHALMDCNTYRASQLSLSDAPLSRSKLCIKYSATYNQWTDRTVHCTTSTSAVMPNIHSWLL